MNVYIKYDDRTYKGINYQVLAIRNSKIKCAIILFC